MRFEELKHNVMNFIVQEHGESDEHYAFFIKEAMEILRDHGNYEKAWEEIRAYDGNTKRPKLAFFKNVVYTTGQSYDDVFIYYQCPVCGSLLSKDSNGGCPVCHSPSGEMKFSKAPKKVIKCQSACFDCSVYSEYAIGPGCPDFGTPRFMDCKDRGNCKCATCCRYEYLRAYKSSELKVNATQEAKRLPDPLSEASKAFYEGRASFIDVNKLLKHIASTKAQ